MSDTGNLNVDIVEMETAILQMGNSIENFREIGENAFSAELAELEPMNSDFVEKLSRVLECVKGWNLMALIQNLDTFWTDATTILGNLKSTDEAHNVERVKNSNG